MQFIKTICVFTVLGALGYGAFTTLTGSPPSDPPDDAVNWESPPRIDLPGSHDVGQSISSISPATPPGGSAPRYSPPGQVSGPPPVDFSAGPATGGAGAAPATSGSPPAPMPGTATITGVRTETSPAPYPSTDVPPGRFDVHAASPLTPVSVGSTSGGAPPATTSDSASSSPSIPTSPTNSVVMPAAAIEPAGATSVAAPSPAVATAPSPSSAAAAALSPSSASGASAPVAAGPSGRKAMSEIQSLLDAGQWAKALDELSLWFDDPSLSPDADRQVMALLDQLAGAVIYSREHLLEPVYVVGQGESLQMIAAKYEVTPELLAKINGITNPLYLPTGTRLKVVRGPFHALVDKDRRRLSLFLNRAYAGSFPVGFGRDRIIADGNYVVRGKTVNPPYQATDTAMSPDDPNNPLGEHYVDLGSGLAIHGTNDPAGLSNDQARGMIRLTPIDAADVFDILTPGSKVVIRP